MDASPSTSISLLPSAWEAIFFIAGLCIFIVCVIAKRSMANPNIEKLKDLPLLWAWSLNALVNHENKTNHFIYAGAYNNTWASNHKAYRKRLKLWWGIDSKQKAIGMIEALVNGQIDNPPLMEKARLLLESSPGELAEKAKNSDPLTKVLIDNIEHIRRHQFIAWDYVRAQGVIAWAYRANYFSLREARSYALKAALKTQRTFSSWEEMATNYCLGYYYWMGEERLYQKIRTTTQYLLTHDNSPWVLFDWYMPIDDKD